MKAVLSAIFISLAILIPIFSLPFIFGAIAVTSAYSYYEDGLSGLMLTVALVYLCCLLCYAIVKWIQRKRFSEKEFKALNFIFWFTLIAVFVLFSVSKNELLASVVFLADLLLSWLLCHIAIHWSAKLYSSLGRKAGRQQVQKLIPVLSIVFITLFSGIRVVQYFDEQYLEERSVKWLGFLADHGVANAQYGLGKRYNLGQGIPQDYEESEKWYRFAAEQGHESAQFHLGRFYLTGQHGVIPKDLVEAEKWFRLAEEKGFRAAKDKLKKIRDNKKDLDKHRVAAKLGDANARFRMGKRHYSGGGYEEAVKQFRFAAGRGHGKARTWLGIMHYKGKGVPQNYAEAAKWFKLAAGQSNAEARVWLGSMYYKGKGVSQDSEEARRLFELAAKQGNAEARVWLERM